MQGPLFVGFNDVFKYILASLLLISRALPHVAMLFLFFSARGV